MNVGPVEGRDPEAVMVMETLQACLARIEAGETPIDALRACPDPALRPRLAALLAPTVALHAGAALPEPRRAAMRGSLATLAADLYPPAPPAPPSSSSPSPSSLPSSSPPSPSSTAPGAGGASSQIPWLVGVVAAVGAGAILLAAILRPGAAERVDVPAQGATGATGATGTSPGAASSGMSSSAVRTDAISSDGRSQSDGVAPPLGDIVPVAPSGVQVDDGNDSSGGRSATSAASSTASSARTTPRATPHADAGVPGSPVSGDLGGASTTERPDPGSIPPAGLDRAGVYPLCLSAPVDRPRPAGARAHVVGRVVDTACNPVAGAIVVFTPAGGDVETLARTESDGTYAVTIERGIYDITLDAGAAAIASAWVDGVSRPLDAPSAAVAITVGPSPAPRVDFMLTGGAP